MQVFFWEKLALPALAKFTRYDMWDHLQRYDAQYRKPHYEREADRHEKLAQLLEHAYANVPHYRRKFDSVGLKPRDIRTFEDLRKLPITTKAEIKAAFPEDMIAGNYKAQTLRESQSGATSGEPLHIRMDFGAVVRKYAEITRHELQNGWHVGDPTVHSLPCPYVDYYVRGVIKDGTFVEGLLHLARKRKTLDKDFMWFVENYVVFPVLHRRLLLYPVISLEGEVDDALCQEHLDRMARFKPKMARSHPLYSYLWARHVQGTGRPPPQIAAVEATGGLASRFMKEFTEQHLQTRVYDYYGSAEIGGIAAECHQHTGMHVYENILHMEFLRAGQPAAPEETASIVITDLENFAMPFIRYWTDDVGRYHERTQCSCGLDTVRMEVEGRTFEMLVDADGNELSSEQAMDRIWQAAPDLYLYQLHLTEPGKAALRVFEDRQSRSVVDDAVEGLRELLGPGTDVQPEFTDRLPTERRGKYCFIKEKYQQEMPGLFPDGRPDKPRPSGT